MDTAIELTAIFRLPLLWCALFLCVGSGLLGLANPRFLKAISSASVGEVDTRPDRGLLGKSIHADRFLLKHTRLFGLCALGTAAVLFYQIA